MALSETQPTDQELNARWPYWLRVFAAAFNVLETTVGGGGIITPSFTAVNMGAGDTSLNIDTDLSESAIEIVGLTADAAVNLTTITGGSAGQVKYIIALDGNITVIQDTGTAGGTTYLNAPVGVDLTLNIRDVLALVNIGGDGATVDGYWLEMYRKLQV